jgi:hypothetical protein
MTWTNYLTAEEIYKEYNRGLETDLEKKRIDNQWVQILILLTIICKLQIIISILFMMILNKILLIEHYSLIIIIEIEIQ